jgi:hypothetical protein
MLSDKFHPYTSDRHGSGKPRIRTQSLRMSSKREILRGQYSGAYYNAIRHVSSGYERPAWLRLAKNPNRRIVPLWHQMGERTQSLRRSSKHEILRGQYSGAYYNAIQQVSPGYERPAWLRHVKNPNRKIAPFWYEMVERTQSHRRSTKREILRSQCTGAKYNAIREASSGYERTTWLRHAKNPNRRIAPFWHKMGERIQSFRRTKQEILRGQYSGAYYNAIRQVSSGYERPAWFWHA